MGLGGVEGVKNFSVGIWDGAPLTAHSSYPMLFLKSEGDIVIASVRLSVRPSVMLSPPKPLDKIKPNLVCELLT